MRLDLAPWCRFVIDSVTSCEIGVPLSWQQLPSPATSANRLQLRRRLRRIRSPPLPRYGRRRGQGAAVTLSARRVEYLAARRGSPRSPIAGSCL